MTPIGMRFHRRVQDTLRSFLPGFLCLGSRSLRPGDYDANGFVEEIWRGSWSRTAVVTKKSGESRYGSSVRCGAWSPRRS